MADPLFFVKEFVGHEVLPLIRAQLELRWKNITVLQKVLMAPVFPVSIP